MASDKTTLVSVYNDYSTAQKVESELIQSGFSRQDVRVTSNDSAVAQSAAAGESYTSATQHEGGITGFFKNLFGGHDDIDEPGYYSQAVNRGGAVVTVTVDSSRVDAATAIMNRYNPVDFDEKEGSFATASSSSSTAVKSSGERVIPVVEEDIQVGKRSVQRGGVRVYTRITEKPVSETVNLREERARVERRPVDRPATDADFRLKDEVVEVLETSEEAVVGKTARVVEEVVVGKESSDRTQTIKDTVRRTDVQVERISPEVDRDFRTDYQSRYSGQGDYDQYEPAYGYGYTLRNNPSYQGRNWSDIEDQARTEYSREYPNSTWERVKNAVRYGWDKTTGK